MKNKNTKRVTTDVERMINEAMMNDPTKLSFLEEGFNESSACNLQEPYANYSHEVFEEQDSIRSIESAAH